MNVYFYVFAFLYVLCCGNTVSFLNGYASEMY